eukprot:snap_masked-scaffold_5-processed-gene-12.43-mRNA-1 protein AED:1.00 eAED:1.00 QI:0/-1/0/0/-1/1/1/0/240
MFSWGKAAKEETPAPPQEPFDPSVMYDGFNQCLKQTPDGHEVLALPFVSAMEEVPKLMASLASQMSFVNKGIVDKYNITRDNIKPTAEHFKVSEVEVTLEKIIERDIEFKWTHTGKKVTPQHATRNIVRLVWFLDFVYALFTKLANDHEKTMKVIFQECWDSALKPRQNFLVKNAVTAALKVASFPDKDGFMKDSLKLEVGSDAALQASRETLLEYSKIIDTLKSHLWNFFEQNNVSNVP